jgi:hypothetical protein
VYIPPCMLRADDLISTLSTLKCGSFASANRKGVIPWQLACSTVGHKDAENIEMV